MERKTTRNWVVNLYDFRPPHQLKVGLSLPLGYLGIRLGYGLTAALPAVPVGFGLGYTAGSLLYNKLTNGFEERQADMYDALSSIQDSRRRLEDIARSMRPPEDVSHTGDRVGEDGIIDEDDR